MTKDSMGGKTRMNPFAEKWRAKNKARHEALEKAKVGKVGSGTSHISKKSYKHDTQN